MTDDSEIIDDEEGLDLNVEEPKSVEAKLKIIEARCKASGIEFERKSFENTGTYATISMKSGKSSRKYSIFGITSANRIIDIEFEKYRYIEGYEAICSYDKGLIEGSVRSTLVATDYLLSRISGKALDPTRRFEGSISISPPSDHAEPTIELGPASDEFRALGRAFGNVITVKFRGCRFKTNDEAAQILSSYSNSLFYQIDKIHGNTFILRREASRRVPLRRLNAKPASELNYPRSKYNQEAMSLYWYGRSARDMPLLQYLAFYQAIEYFFPRYAHSEARRRLGYILKSPAFRHHSSDDLDRIISAIQISRSGGIGNEKSQLRAVINECLSAEDLHLFLTQDADRESHFSTKSGGKNYHRIPLGGKETDFRNDVADRIYDIRCKIVHTKNDDRDEPFSMLLPFSKDAEHLLLDIQLVKFVADAVLVASSDAL